MTKRLSFKEILDEYGKLDTFDVLMKRINETGDARRPEVIKYEEQSELIGRVWGFCLMEELSHGKAEEITSVIIDRIVKQEIAALTNSNQDGRDSIDTPDKG